LFKKYKLIFLIGFGSALLSFSVFYLWSTWTLMVALWLGVVFWVAIKGIDQNLPEQSRKIFWFTVFVYPLVESFLKWLIVADIIPYSWDIINRIEHFLWVMALGVILFPFLRGILAKLEYLERVLFLFGFLMSLGIFNELFEFLLRIWQNKPLQLLGADYYVDTVFDFGMNILGGTLISLILALTELKSSDKKKRASSS